MNNLQERTRGALELVRREVEAARFKHPGTDHTLAALVEEVGELAQSLLEGNGNFLEEAVQVAAVAVRIISEGDRQFPFTLHSSENPAADYWERLALEALRGQAKAERTAFYNTLKDDRIRPDHGGPGGVTNPSKYKALRPAELLTRYVGAVRNSIERGENFFAYRDNLRAEILARLERLETSEAEIRQVLEKGREGLEDSVKFWQSRERLAAEPPKGWEPPECKYPGFGGFVRYDVAPAGLEAIEPAINWDFAAPECPNPVRPAEQCFTDAELVAALNRALRNSRETGTVCFRDDRDRYQAEVMRRLEDPARRYGLMFELLTSKDNPFVDLWRDITGGGQKSTGE